eukprot:459538_1
MISLHLTMSTFCVCIDVLGILVWQMSVVPSSFINSHQIQDNGIIERTMDGMEWYIIFIDILVWNRPTVYVGSSRPECTTMKRALSDEVLLVLQLWFERMGSQNWIWNGILLIAPYFVAW